MLRDELPRAAQASAGRPCWPRSCRRRWRPRGSSSPSGTAPSVRRRAANGSGRFAAQAGTPSPPYCSCHMSWWPSNMHPDLLLGEQAGDAVDAPEVRRVGDAGLLRGDAGPQHPEPGAVEAVLLQPGGVPRGEAGRGVRRRVGRVLPHQVEPVHDHDPAVLVDQEAPSGAAAACRRRRRPGRRGERERDDGSRSSASFSWKVERVPVRAVTRRRRQSSRPWPSVDDDPPELIVARAGAQWLSVPRVGVEPTLSGF